MNDNEIYEIKAEMFRRMTGEIAPGKSAAPASYPLSYKTRAAMYEVWTSAHKDILNVMAQVLTAMEAERTDA